MSQQSTTRGANREAGYTGRTDGGAQRASGAYPQNPAGILSPSSALLSVRGLKKYYPIRAGFFGRVAGHVRAVDGVSFDIPRGKTLGLVGESGCGKTTVGKTILRLTELSGGEVMFDGKPVHQLNHKELQP
ncbi:MAG: ABC transporter ATP-binding protein, partial [Oscillospiraceae bacterium]|nr:ABC transporter ATP-binding protein [Oscillospiraceae bacterium]